MKFYKQTVRDVPIENKTVLVRADYNVPLAKNGKITDDLRVQASLPTIKYLVKKGCRVIIISHLGRPEGPKDTQFSLEPVASHLAYLLGSPVHFVPETFGDRVKQAVKKLPPRGVMVLENLRFHKQEEANDHDFAQRIVKSTGAQYFVQDGFGVVHRAHASTDALTELLPSVAGLLLEKEYTTISDSINDP
ncbi:MAG: phosphoglycerate kinase, partial [bacterium]|nr:phosphoglycerate kinase [bacterium]